MAMTDDKDKERSKMSDARMSGMVATMVLVFLALLTVGFVLIGS